MYLKDIWEGNEDFIGIANLVSQFLEKNEEEILKENSVVGFDVRKQVQKSIEYLCDISKGVIPTTSTIIRNFVRSHPEYKNDSVLTEVIKNFFLFNFLEFDE